MSQRKALIEAFVEEYKNHHNWNCVDTYVAEDCQLHLPLPGLPTGREGMRENGRMMCTAFPDVHVTRELRTPRADLSMPAASLHTLRNSLLGRRFQAWDCACSPMPVRDPLLFQGRP